MKQPQLNDGEVYAGALIKSDGTGHHIILLPGNEQHESYSDYAWLHYFGNGCQNWHTSTASSALVPSAE